MAAKFLTLHRSIYKKSCRLRLNSSTTELLVDEAADIWRSCLDEAYWDISVCNKQKRRGKGMFAQMGHVSRYTLCMKLTFYLYVKRFSTEKIRRCSSLKLANCEQLLISSYFYSLNCYVHSKRYNLQRSISLAW